MSAPVYERILDLWALRVDTLFGIPDPGFIHMAMTSEKRGGNPVAPHYKQAGGFMADAWSCVTGKPGGLPYAIGAAIATVRKRPVVLITGDSSFMFHIAELETASSPATMAGGSKSASRRNRSARVRPRRRRTGAILGADRQDRGGIRRVRRARAGHSSRHRARPRQRKAYGNSRTHRPNGQCMGAPNYE